MSWQDPPYKIVLERSATFQHYYLMEVYPLAPLTVTMELPGKQAKRIYARFYLDMSVKEIAQVEGVDPRRVRDSIHLGLKKLEKVFSQASE